VLAKLVVGRIDGQGGRIGAVVGAGQDKPDAGTSPALEAHRRGRGVAAAVEA